MQEKSSLFWDFTYLILFKVTFFVLADFACLNLAVEFSAVNLLNSRLAIYFS